MVRAAGGAACWAAAASGAAAARSRARMGGRGMGCRYVSCPVAPCAWLLLAGCGRAAHRRSRGCLQLEEIANQPLAVLGKGAFGVELDAFYRVLLVPEPYDDAVCGAGRDLEFLGEAFFRDDERVVPGAGHRAVDAGEDGAAVVLHGAGFAVHELWRAHDVAPECRDERLVAEADTKDGHLARE